jgi:formamidopyrimidine-DNA glycosylase
MSMPELPEVETVRRGLVPVMVGRRIDRLEQRRVNLRFPFPDNFVARLEGRRIERLERRAKYLMAYIEGADILTMHLGMSGRFTIAQAGGANGQQLADFVHDSGHDPKHDHVVFAMSGGATVTYNDARRFGYMTLFAASDLETHPHFADLGIEPLNGELTARFLAKAARGKTCDLKAFLMDQRIVAGLGNIYVCEALFRAGLKPTTPAGRLVDRRGAPRAGAVALVPAITSVLEAAIEAGGSTLRDYKQADGSLGYFQHRFAVYGREGEPCVRDGCGGTITRLVQSNRSTFYCPACQR